MNNQPWKTQIFRHSSTYTTIPYAPSPIYDRFTYRGPTSNNCPRMISAFGFVFGAIPLLLPPACSAIVCQKRASTLAFQFLLRNSLTNSSANWTPGNWFKSKNETLTRMSFNDQGCNGYVYFSRHTGKGTITIVYASKSPELIVVRTAKVLHRPR